ncbi:MAG: efflux RND transporter periplasmic adaptor subunit [Phycisphaerae bacterium]|jgi:RND family efflux transporter MFP subunit
MRQESADLSLLSRERDGNDGVPKSKATGVPPPRRRWKTRVLLPVGILGATAALMAYAAGDALWPATPVRVVPVIVKAGVTAPAGQVVAQAPGWVEADPFPTAISALADGVVQEMLVLEGQPVHAGQVVARLVPDDANLALANAEADLSQRRAELTAATAILKAAQGDWDNPVELTRKLATAEATHAEKQAELDRWPSELAAEEALAVYYEAELRRVAPLHTNGQASDIELIQVQQQHARQQAVVAATRARQPILEAQLAALDAEVAAARENLRLRIADRRALDEAQAAVEQAQARVQAAEAARDEAALRQSRMEVRSPADGVVMNRLAEPGSKLMLGGDNPHSAQVARLYDPQRLQVRVDVPLVDAAKVGVGQAAEVIVEVLPERVFRGSVVRIVHEADVQKNTLQVKVAIEAPTADLKPEMLARAKFLAGGDEPSSQPAERVLIPESAVHRMAGGMTHVWLADQAADVARSRMVTVGRAGADGWIEVLEGLQPGDRLIIDPSASLRDGGRVRIVGEAPNALVSAQGGTHHGTD